MISNLTEAQAAETRHPLGIAAGQTRVSLEPRLGQDLAEAAVAMGLA